MTTTEELEPIEQDTPEVPVVPEVRVEGDEAVIRVNTPEGVDERRVKLPKTTWG